MRAVIDTNVLLSGLLWHGVPHALIEQVRAGALTLVSSQVLLAELGEVLSRPKFQAALARSNINSERMLTELRQWRRSLIRRHCRHRSVAIPMTMAVLAFGVAAQADLIVSGDADLLILGAHAGYPHPQPGGRARYDRRIEAIR